MKNLFLIEKYLSENGKYPQDESGDGIIFDVNTDYNQLRISGTPSELIEFSDLLLSLALSGKNVGQHWHLDNVQSNFVYTIQTESNHIDSKIVKDNQIIFLINRIKEIHPKIKNVYFNLVYRATEDGDKASDFHCKCDKIGPNITLIKTRKGQVFGGFTIKNWEHMQKDIDVNKPNLGSATRDARAFGFSVSNQKIYNNEKPNEFAIWCNRKFGPTFKNNLFQILDSSLRKGG